MKVYLKILVIYIICLMIFNGGYYPLIPTIPVYPDNNREIIRLKQIINNRKKKDVAFFHLTNKSVVYAFKPHVDISIQELFKIEAEPVYIILFFKYLINRARPRQVDKIIKPIDISTAQTPAFPAGHAYQAYYLSKKLSLIYPEKRDLFYKLAIKCDETRVKAGLHYPSDGRFARQLVDVIKL